MAITNSIKYKINIKGIVCRLVLRGIGLAHVGERAERDQRFGFRLCVKKRVLVRTATLEVVDDDFAFNLWVEAWGKVLRFGGSGENDDGIASQCCDSHFLSRLGLLELRGLGEKAQEWGEAEEGQQIPV